MREIVSALLFSPEQRAAPLAAIELRVKPNGFSGALSGRIALRIDLQLACGAGQSAKARPLVSQIGVDLVAIVFPHRR